VEIPLEASDTSVSYNRIFLVTVHARSNQMLLITDIGSILKKN
jgi:hypothetical protein